MINVLCFISICLFQLANAWDIQSYDLRMKDFADWQAKQEKIRQLRQAAGQDHREVRLKELLQKIRARQKFKREYRTTAHLEEEYLKSLEGKYDYKSQDRQEFSRVHKKYIKFYEQKVLPMKKIEYGLETPPELSSSGQGDSND